MEQNNASVYINKTTKILQMKLSNQNLIDSFPVDIRNLKKERVNGLQCKSFHHGSNIEIKSQIANICQRQSMKAPLFTIIIAVSWRTTKTSNKLKMCYYVHEESEFT